MKGTNMKRTLLGAVALVLLASAGMARAQYIWMDSNGDGVHTIGDVMNANGTPTTVDVWINTSHNKNGSLATCDSNVGDLAVWNSYAMHINAINGTATFANFVNQQPSFTIGCSAVVTYFITNNSTEMGACAATGSPINNGGTNQKMFTVMVTGQTGSPSLVFVPTNNQDQNNTSFETLCTGLDFDHIYKLGSDFFDNDGLSTIIEDTYPPVLTLPATAGGTEEMPFTITALASDPDAGQLVTLSQTNNAPFLVSGTSAGPAASPVSLTVSGTPNFSQAGSYTISWSAHDNATPVNGTSTASTALTIANVDRPPAVAAPPSFAGTAGQLVTFGVDVSDPDGDPIASLTASPLPAGAVFSTTSSNTSATFNWTPAATQVGTINVTFTATNALSGSLTTVIAVASGDQSLGVRAFVWGGNKTIRLRSGKPSFCAQLEPANGSFQAADIDLGSIVMRYTSGATTTEIHATTDKAATLRDLDGNGVLEVSACFAKADLIRLFSSVVGRVPVTVEIAGRLATTGATFSVPLTVEVIGSTGTLAASVAPNPFNPSTTLSFETPRGGPVELLVFDLAGRLVRDVTHRAYYAPGIYDIHLDALDEGGHRLASGVYFYRLATPEGSVTGRLVLMQ